MLIVGLTGGIGSGKTTVANLFAEFNIPIIDADIIAREITQPGYPAYQQIIAHFGDHILAADKQQINRSALRHLIFTDSQQRQWLEKLLHPLIFAEIKNRLTTLQAPYCIVVIPLLIEVSPVDFIDRILVIDLPEAEQIARVAQRDHLAVEQVGAILAAQSKREGRLAKAHDVISNADDPAALKAKVAELHRRYLAGG